MVKIKRIYDPVSPDDGKRLHTARGLANKSFLAASAALFGDVLLSVAFVLIFT